MLVASYPSDLYPPALERLARDRRELVRLTPTQDERPVWIGGAPGLVYQPPMTGAVATVNGKAWPAMLAESAVLSTRAAWGPPTRSRSAV